MTYLYVACERVAVQSAECDCVRTSAKSTRHVVGCNYEVAESHREEERENVPRENVAPACPVTSEHWCALRDRMQDAWSPPYELPGPSSLLPPGTYAFESVLERKRWSVVVREDGSGEMLGERGEKIYAYEGRDRADFGVLGFTCPVYGSSWTFEPLA